MDMCLGAERRERRGGGGGRKKKRKAISLARLYPQPLCPLLVMRAAERVVGIAICKHTFAALNSAPGLGAERRESERRRGGSFQQGSFTLPHFSRSPLSHLEATPVLPVQAVTER